MFADHAFSAICLGGCYDVFEVAKALERTSFPEPVNVDPTAVEDDLMEVECEQQPVKKEKAEKPKKTKNKKCPKQPADSEMVTPADGQGFYQPGTFPGW